MVAPAMPTAGASLDDAGWRRLLFALCGLTFVLLLIDVADVFGIGGRPWLGYWDSLASPTERPFIIAFRQIVPGGASARAGIREGDLLDLREQSLEARLERLGMALAVPTTLVIHRGTQARSVRVIGTTVWEVQPQLKLPEVLTPAITTLWFLGCALLIALRASWSRPGRILALILLCGAPLVYTPNPFVTLLYVFGVTTVGFAGSLLLIYLTSCFGTRYEWRRLLESCAYVSAALSFIAGIAGPIGTVTLWFDPWPYLFGPFWQFEGEFVQLMIAVLAIIAVACTPRSNRSRAAWLILPLPFSAVAASVIGIVGQQLNSTWYVYEGLSTASSALSLLGAAAVTYALLKRRVLDFGFVLNRTIVVAIVSLIVVAAFVLLEWLLGTVIAGVSHATSLIANAALALVIGVLLGYIQKSVDRFVDSTLFRKRHEDERALLDFSKEAGYVTNSEALLDAAIRQIERHTDARNAAILLDQRGSYAAVRSFGDGIPPAVDENDDAVLALKAWHKPLDPHHYSTSMRGALALPMLARGRLIGLVISGERAGGEAYAPDEIEALSQFAHGLGSALEALWVEPGAVQTRILQVQEQILHELRSLPDKMKRP